MLFGMNLVEFMLFVVIVSFAEALYSPMINVFTFNFTKDGQEGTFLTLTSAPVYFTMALTGIIGGYLLENYYPAVEDKTHKRQPNFIWMTIICFSAVSTITLYFGRDYFNIKEDTIKEGEESIAGISGREYNSDFEVLDVGIAEKIDKDLNINNSATSNNI